METIGEMLMNSPVFAVPQEKVLVVCFHTFIRMALTPATIMSMSTPIVTSDKTDKSHTFWEGEQAKSQMGKYLFAWLYSVQKPIVIFFEFVANFVTILTRPELPLKVPSSLPTSTF